MDFKNFRENCKHEHPGMNEDHQLEYTCRHPANHPKGTSWGECDEAHCPLWHRKSQKEIDQTDREKLVELVCEVIQTEACSRHCNYPPCDMASDIADQLLSHGVTIREQGEWATDTEDIKWGNSLKKKYCTVCGKRPHFDKEKREFILSDFCPNCGNPMKGERP